MEPTVTPFFLVITGLLVLAVFVISILCTCLASQLRIALADVKAERRWADIMQRKYESLLRRRQREGEPEK